MEEEEDGIVEVASSGGTSAARPIRSESRWVDGSEVDSAESPPWFDDLEEPTRTFSGSSGGSIRRRLGKKPKRVDSLDVEAMAVPGAHNHGHKVIRVRHSFLLQQLEIWVFFNRSGFDCLITY